jgi:hypothetical protein
MAGRGQFFAPTVGFCPGLRGATELKSHRPQTAAKRKSNGANVYRHAMREKFDK